MADASTAGRIGPLRLGMASGVYHVVDNLVITY